MSIESPANASAETSESTAAITPHTLAQSAAVDFDALRTPARGTGRRPGRPLEMAPDDVLRVIRELSAGKRGLFRVHITSPGLYARARRLFGSWSAAVRRAGVDYELAQSVARVRSLKTRRRNRRGHAPARTHEDRGGI